MPSCYSTVYLGTFATTGGWAEEIGMRHKINLLASIFFISYKSLAVRFYSQLMGRRE
jgi:hypothetical protein